jgi:hypothetical protein
MPFSSKNKEKNALPRMRWAFDVMDEEVMRFRRRMSMHRSRRWRRRWRRMWRRRSIV